MSVEDRLAKKVALINRTLEQVHRYKENHPESKVGYQLSWGGLLNAYREGDISFDECIQQLKEIMPELST